MSPRTKRRRNRRKAIAGIVSIIRSEPCRTDPYWVGLFACGPAVVAGMCFYVAHMKWELTHNIAMMSSHYERAMAVARPEL